MGEYYWGELSLFIPDKMPNPFLDSDLAVNPESLTKFKVEFGVAYPKFSHKEVEGLLAEMLSWAEGAEVMSTSGNAVLIAGEHNYGGAWWLENTDLAPTCQSLGISYTIIDEGHYDIPGEAVSWTPETGFRSRAVLPGGEIALDESTARKFLEEAAGQGSFGQAVLDYFDIQSQPVT